LLDNKNVISLLTLLAKENGNDAGGDHFARHARQQARFNRWEAANKSAATIS